MLKIVEAGIEWGPAYDEAEVRYIIFQNKKIGEIFLSERYSLVIKFYEVPEIKVNGNSEVMRIEVEDLL